MMNKTRAPSSHIFDGHIDALQAAAMVIVISVSKIFLVYAERMIRAGMSGAWMIPLGAALLSSLWLVPLVRVLEQYPGMNLIEVSRQLLGPVPAALFGISYCAYNLSIAVLGAYETGSVLTSAVLTLTPRGFMDAVGLLSCILIAVTGVESISRTSVVAVFGTILSLALLTVLSLNRMRIEQLYPLLGTGVASLVKASVVRQAMYVDILGLGFLASYLRNPRDVSRVARTSILISCGIFFVVTLITILTTRPEETVHHAAPLLRLARRIYLGRFFQRFDLVFVPFWLFSQVVWFGISFWVSGIALASVFSLKWYKPLVVATGLLTYVLSLFVPNYAGAIVLDFDVVRPLGVLLVYLWVLTVFAASRLKRTPEKEGT